MIAPLLSNARGQPTAQSDVPPLARRHELLRHPARALTRTRFFTTLAMIRREWFTAMTPPETTGAPRVTILTEPQGYPVV